MDIVITYMYEAGVAGFDSQRQKNWPFFLHLSQPKMQETEVLESKVY